MAVLKNRDVLLVLILIVMVFISGMLFFENKEQDDRIKKLEGQIEKQTKQVKVLDEKFNELESNVVYLNELSYDMLDILDSHNTMLTYMFY